jgi:hypothetical protein
VTRTKLSAAPPGLRHRWAHDPHGFRRGLHSPAAPRLTELAAALNLPRERIKDPGGENDTAAVVIAAALSLSVSEKGRAAQI